MEIVSENAIFGGRQLTIRHDSAATGTPMRCAVFLPPQDGPRPTLYYLSGLTCTEDNVTQKAGAQRIAAELGMIFVALDTSPRGDGVADDEAYDLGQGAGFYVDATETPWAPHFSMYSYITDELPKLIAAEFPVDTGRVGITGHSMGGHGALTLALNHPEQYRLVSAFAPICAPSQCPWGEKALGNYLGSDRAAWQKHDAVALIEANGFDKPILVEQGAADSFLQEQLKPDLLQAACDKAGVALTLNLREGYDHSYYFIASFIEAHLRFHCDNLMA